MILGELIGLIALPVMLVLFVVGIVGMIHEINTRYDRPILDFIYVVFFCTGLVVGISLIIWFFIVSGAGESICLFVSNLWNTSI